MTTIEAEKLLFDTGLTKLEQAECEDISSTLNLHMEDLTEVFRVAALHWMQTKPEDIRYAQHLAGIAYAFMVFDD